MIRAAVRTSEALSAASCPSGERLGAGLVIWMEVQDLRAGLDGGTRVRG